MAKRLYDVLCLCKKEEEVKEQFVKFFKIKRSPLKQIDLYSIDIWDVGFWQIKQALKEVFLGDEEFENLKDAHKKLGQKLLSQIYEYGFIYQDVQRFEEDS